MARRQRVARVAAPVEYTAPVAYKVDACRMSDESWLPMTVFHVTEKDCAYFEVHNAIILPKRYESKDVTVQPLITYLPTRYFVQGNV